MSRQLKFRAWDKVNKKVRKVMSLDFYNTRQSEVTLASDGDVYFRYLEQVELMQYTGLKDKNGNEIYEGDILKTRIGGYEQASPYVVEDMRKLYFELKRDDSYYRIQKTEILGNIYENPELLEEEE